MKRIAELVGAAILGGTIVAAIAFGVSRVSAQDTAASQQPLMQQAVVAAEPQTIDALLEFDAQAVAEPSAIAEVALGDCGNAIDPELRAALHEATQSAVAQALGMTVEELEAAREAGQDIGEIAEEKGIDPETIRAAIEAARKAVLDAAVADGTITQEQADRLLTPRSPRPGNGNGGGPRGPEVQIDPTVRESIHTAVEAAVAEALGVTVEELQAARESNTPLEQIAEQNGVTLEAVREAAQAAREAAIQQAVADGLLTQEQADALKNSPPHRPGGRGPGRPGGQGGQGGPGPSGPQQP